MKNENEQQPVQRDNFSLSPSDIKTLISVGAIPKEAPPDVIEFFSRSCAQSRLSPFKRQIHLIRRHTKDGDRYTLQTGIDGFRTISDRTGRYAGNDEYLFDEGLTIYQMLEQKREKPRTAKATVWKIVGGVRCPFTAEVRWVEYYPGGNQGFMWDKMPFNQLGKCAEAAAHRKAFPEETSGIYTDDEMIVESQPLIKRAQVPKLEGGDAPSSTTTVNPAETSMTGIKATDAGSGASNVPPADAPKTKLTKKKKAPSIDRPNEAKLRERLAEVNVSMLKFFTVAQDNEWLPAEAKSIEDVPDEKLAQFLDDENFAVIVEALK